MNRLFTAHDRDTDCVLCSRPKSHRNSVNKDTEFNLSRVCVCVCVCVCVDEEGSFIALS